MFIRQAEGEDIQALQKIEEAGFSTDRISARQMRFHVSNKNAVFLVAAEEPEASIVGYALTFMRSHSGTARLYSIVISNDMQGRGLAKALMSETESLLRTKGIKVWSLEVDKNDQKTINIYMHYGFAPGSTLPEYYQDGRDALKMKKEIK
tara:strand:+ start:465 stop:914 length:450 start_codon:yes stop_codon:yes gene_type:complete